MTNHKFRSLQNFFPNKIVVYYKKNNFSVKHNGILQEVISVGQ